MKTYTTGQVAQICKITPAQARKLLDGKGVDIELKESKLRRRTTRHIRLRQLIKLMAENGFSFDGFDVIDTDAQKMLLCQRVEELKEAVSKAKKRGDIIAKAGQSTDIFMDIYHVLGSLEDVRGISRNNSWARVFEKMAEVIKQHTKVCISNSKK